MSAPTETEMAASHVTKTYPLNSRRLTAETLSRIAKALGLPTTASVAETRQLIEGKLGEEYEPRNVQVDLVEVEPGVVGIQLRSADGIIVEIPPEKRTGEEREIDGVRGRRRPSDYVTSREEHAWRARRRSSNHRARELESELERVQEARQRPGG